MNCFQQCHLVLLAIHIIFSQIFFTFVVYIQHKHKQKLEQQQTSRKLQSSHWCRMLSNFLQLNKPSLYGDTVLPNKNIFNTLNNCRYLNLIFGMNEWKRAFLLAVLMFQLFTYPQNLRLTLYRKTWNKTHKGYTAETRNVIEICSPVSII